LGAACVTAGGVGGAMLLTGVVLVTVVPTFVTVPWDLNAAGIGQGGSGVQYVFSTDAAPWTTGVGQAVTPSGASLVVSGSASVLPGGPITLVSPVYVHYANEPFKGLASLTLDQASHAVPAPAAWLQLGTGLLGLALLYRRR
jgi:hypothetical protein